MKVTATGKADYEVNLQAGRRAYGKAAKEIKTEAGRRLNFKGVPQPKLYESISGQSDRSNQKYKVKNYFKNEKQKQDDQKSLSQNKLNDRKFLKIDAGYQKPVR